MDEDSYGVYVKRIAENVEIFLSHWLDNRYLGIARLLLWPRMFTLQVEKDFRQLS